ncbi:MAG: transposase [Acidithiobacillales bacterium]
MKDRVSPSTRRRYPFTMICKAYHLARSSGYAAGLKLVVEEPASKRGPRPQIPDEELLLEIRREIERCPFVGEGHRKLHVRLNGRGVFTGRGRVLRLMRENSLLVPQRSRRVHGNPAHTGTIVTTRPNVMWGADGTTFYTLRDGWCWLFVAIDHASDKVVGHHAAKIGDRFAALEPIKQGVAGNFGRYAGAIAAGLKLRVDWGTQYTSHDFEAETHWLGIDISHSFVGEPQCNGVAERFIRTAKEECLWLHDFEDLEQARPVIAEFVNRYNHHWLIERLGYRTPARAHVELLQEAA